MGFRVSQNWAGKCGVGPENSAKRQSENHFLINFAIMDHDPLEQRLSVLVYVIVNTDNFLSLGASVSAQAEFIATFFLLAAYRSP